MSTMKSGESAAPRPHITPKTRAKSLATKPDALLQGIVSVSATSAHVDANMRGSRWVAAYLTDGVSMNIAAATAPAKRLAGRANLSMNSPLMRLRTKNVVRRHSATVEITPQTGASMLPAPKSFAKKAING